MKRSDLAKWLREIAEAVESGDSAEGRVSWMLPESGDPDAVVVDAAVRTDNLHGQGGMLVITEVSDVETISETPH